MIAIFKHDNKIFFVLLFCIIIMELSSTGRCVVEEKKNNPKPRHVKRIYVTVFMVVIVTLSALLES